MRGINRRVRLLTILVAGLIFAGVALAVGPSSVTVKQGTLLHGDAQSLATIDGDTLDIEAVFADGRYRVFFTADFPAGTGNTFRTLHWAAWASHRTKCRIVADPNRAEFIGKTLTSGAVSNLPLEAVTGWASCKSRAPFVLHWDRMTVDE